MKQETLSGVQDTVRRALDNISSTAPVAADPLDNVISAFIILFILSVITEKFVALVRRYPRTFRLILALAIATVIYGFLPDGRVTMGLYFLSLVVIFVHFIFRRFDSPGVKPTLVEQPLIAATQVLANIRKSRNGTPATAPEDVIEREVMLLSFIIGCIVAFLFRADLITIFTEGHYRALGWVAENNFMKFDTGLMKICFGDVSLGDIFSRTTMGIFLTGFFLSFGSKFFHDLLDTLMQVKQYKRKLNTQETFELESVADLKEFLEASNSDVLRAAYEQNQALFADANIRDVTYGTVETPSGRRMALHVHLKDAETGGLPQAIAYKLSSGRTIPVRVIYHTDVDQVVIHALRGDSIYVKKTFPGTLGVILRERSSSKQYALTCSHVINDGRSTSAMGYVPQGQSISVAIEDSVQNMLLTERVHFDLRNHVHDVALIGELTDVYTNRRNHVELRGARAITDNDIQEHLPVAFHGFTSGFSRGVLIGKSIHPVEIQYQDKTVEMHGLLLATRKAAEPYVSISKSGDSGSVLYSERDGMAVGLILAGNSRLTYIMPLQEFLNALDLEIANI